MPIPISLRVQLFVIWLLAPIAWLPLVRGALQPGYEWALFGLSGRGVGGGYTVLFGVTAATWVLVYWAWRRPNFPLVRLALVGWFAAVTALLAVPAARGEGLIFQGDTLGVRVNLTWVAVAVFAALLALGIKSAASGLKTADVARPPRSTQPLRRPALGLALVLALVQVPCLVFGDLQGRASQIGVVATILQALALVAALRVSRRPRRSESFLLA